MWYDAAPLLHGSLASNVVMLMRRLSRHGRGVDVVARRKTVRPSWRRWAQERTGCMLMGHAPSATRTFNRRACGSSCTVVVEVEHTPCSVQPSSADGAPSLQRPSVCVASGGPISRCRDTTRRCLGEWTRCPRRGTSRRLQHRLSMRTPSAGPSFGPTAIVRKYDGLPQLPALLVHWPARARACVDSPAPRHRQLRDGDTGPSPGSTATPPHTPAAPCALPAASAQHRCAAGWRAATGWWDPPDALHCFVLTVRGPGRRVLVSVTVTDRRRRAHYPLAAGSLTREPRWWRRRPTGPPRRRATRCCGTGASWCCPTSTRCGRCFCTEWGQASGARPCASCSSRLPFPLRNPCAGLRAERRRHNSVVLRVGPEPAELHVGGGRGQRVSGCRATEGDASGSAHVLRALGLENPR